MSDRRFARTGVALTLGLLVAAAPACSDGGGVAPPVDLDPTDGSAVICSDGGFVSLGAAVRLEIPAGVVARCESFTIAAVPTPPDLAAEGAVGQAYRFAPVGVALSGAVTITFFVPPSVRGGLPASVVTLRRSTDVVATLSPAGVLLDNVITNGDLVSGGTTILGVFSAAIRENRAPTAEAGPDQTVDVGDRVQLNGSGSDPDGDPLAFSWTVVAPDGTTAVVDGATQASASFVAAQTGTYVATLTVEDGRGGTATSTAEVTAEAVVSNQPPTANAGNDQVVEVGDTVTLNGVGDDPDGDPLTFAWTVRAPDGTAVAVSGADQPTATFVAGQQGTYTATLTVDDGRGGTATSTVDITAQAATGNQAPVAVAGSDQTASVGDMVTLNGSASGDPDGDAITFQWSQAGGPPVTITDPMMAVASFVPAAPGTYVFALVVSDGSLTDEDTVTITVGTNNQAPTVSLTGPSAVLLGSQVDVQAMTSDPENDPVTITWTVTGPSGPVPFTVQGGGSSVVFTPPEAGGYTVTARASDGINVAVAQRTVVANLVVAGTYADTLFRIDNANSFCPDGTAGQQAVGDLVVTQPSPGVVTLRLSTLTSFILNDATGSLTGNFFNYSGPIDLDTDGDGIADFTATGTISGTFTPGPPPGVNLRFNFNISLCTASGVIVK